MKKRGVLLMAYGAPDSLDDVEAFYTDIRRGRPPSPELLDELLNRYRRIGGSSPLLAITNRQAAALQEQLGNAYGVYVGMRHWHPRIADTIAQMVDDGIEEAVAIVLAPHYSTLSIRAYMQLVDKACTELNDRIRFHQIESWHTEAHYLSALGQRLTSQLQAFAESGLDRQDVTVIFTAHSLPTRILQENDPYPTQLLETSQRLAQALDLPHWQLAYQSAGRTADPWLGPDVLEALDRLALDGCKAALICVIGFVADHLEVLYDLDVEAIDKAQLLGIQLRSIHMLNDDPEFICGLAQTALNAFD
ncbi:MAG: ferrochelatase [Verrucomicrobia bacterium]|nr:ferrochelatase [Verrucomicrobiota bacterium]